MTKRIYRLHGSAIRYLGQKNGYTTTELRTIRFDQSQGEWRIMTSEEEKVESYIPAAGSWGLRRCVVMTLLVPVLALRISGVYNKSFEKQRGTAKMFVFFDLERREVMNWHSLGQ